MSTNAINTTPRRRQCMRRIRPFAFGLLAAFFMLLTSCSEGCGDSVVSSLGECSAAAQTFGTTTTSEIDAAAAQLFSSRRNHTSVVFDGKMWVIGGRKAFSQQYHDVWYSADGKSWIEKTSDASFVPRYGHSSAVFNGRMWVIGGYTGAASGAQNQRTNAQNDVWSSADGANWTQTPTTGTVFVERSLHSSVVFDNKLWVIGGAIDNGKVTGSSSEVWSSPDGAAWTLVSSGKFPARQAHGSAVFDGKIWIVGGESDIPQKSYQMLNDVWSSSDGVNWTQETAAAEFSPRAGIGLVTFGRSLWVVGGRGGTRVPTFSDIWVLRDNGTWFQAPASIPKRSDHTVVPRNLKLFIIGGTDGGTPYSDVWSFR